MSESERNRCAWLQKVANQFLLYYMEKILGALFMTMIKDLYSVAVGDGQDFVWQDVTDHVRKRLSSHDASYLICATHCLRENASTLIQWLLFQQKVRKQCREMEILYPNSL